jgi:tetratricopeptide (TPR) repeat protein
MHNVALAYWNLGRQEQAKTLQEKTLALMKATLGPNHSDTLTCMNSLALEYDALGRHDDALKLGRQILELRRATLGADHPDTLVSMGNVANFCSSLGRHDEALAIREATLALQKAKLGPDHPDTLRSMNNLANSYYGLGRHADALTLRRETLELRQAKLGSKHPDTLLSMANLALSLFKLDHGSEALVLIDDCLRLAAGEDVDRQLAPFVLELRLRVFEKRKDIAGCRQTAEMRERLGRRDAENLYVAACFRAITASVLRTGAKVPGAREQADAEADKAMGWLEQAVAAGFNSPPQVAHMAQDADLDALRGDARFRRLLAELFDRGFPADPLAP